MSKLVALGMTLLMSTGCAESQAVVTAAGSSISLGKFKDMPGITRMSIADNGALACIVGSYLKDESISHSVVMLVDLVQKKTSWVKSISPPPSTPNVYAVGCGFSGADVFVLANAGTNSAMASNKTLAYVFQFSQAGTLLKQEPVPSDARSDHAVDLLNDAGILQAVGYTQDEDDKNEYYAMFMTRVDSSMRLSTSITKEGSYSQFSAMRAIGGHLFAGGRFFPKKAAKTDGLQDYANSRIKSDGRYLWSVRPAHRNVARPGGVQTAINAAGTIYSVAQNKGATSVIAVGANGKVTGSSNYQSTFCDVEQVAAGSRQLLAIRTLCGATKGAPALVSIDPVAGLEQPLALLAGTPRYITTHKQEWYGVAEYQGTLILASGTLEGK